MAYTNFISLQDKVKHDRSIGGNVKGIKGRREAGANELHPLLSHREHVGHAKLQWHLRVGLVSPLAVSLHQVVDNSLHVKILKCENV